MPRLPHATARAIRGAFLGLLAGLCPLEAMADLRLAPELAASAAAGRFPIAAIVDFEPGDLPALRGQFAPALRDDAPGRERLVHLRERVRQAREGLRGRLITRTGSRARMMRSFDHIPQALIEIEDAAALDALLADPAVRAVMPDHRLEADDLEALPLIGQPTVVNSGVRGDGATIAVIDTGVFHTHADFGACTSPGVPASCRVAASIDIATNDGQQDNPANPHGTNVSAIVANTAPGADLVVLDVFDAAGASSSTIIAAYDWVIANRTTFGIRAVNLSLSVPGIYSASDCGNRFTGFAANGSSLPNQSNPFRLSIDSAAAVGIATVSSAGNDGIKNGLPMPACSANSISVGAVYDSAQGSRSWAAGCTDSITAADLVGCFSNSAAILELLAPGITITAGGHSYSGTSQAAPHVAGAWALVAAAFPTETITQLRTRLLNGGRPVLDTLAGITKPRVDLEGVFPPPANDDFAAAVSLAGPQSTVNTSNRFASREAAEPLHAGANGGLSLWWRWTAPGDGRTTVDLAGSGFDTLLGVYTGSGLANLTTIASNDDVAAGNTTSRTTFTVTSGTTYQIAVDGKAGAWGALNLALNWVAASADLVAQLTASPDPVPVGGAVEYRIGVQNNGPDSARSVSAVLALPAGMNAGPPPPGCAAGMGSVSCTRDLLASGGLAEWAIPVTVTTAGSPSAALTVSSATSDPVTTNNSLTRTIQAILPADLTVSVSSSAGTVPHGSNANFTVTVTNQGPGGAGSVQLQLVVSGLGPVSTWPAGCSATAEGALCVLGTLAPGAAVTLPLSFATTTPGSGRVAATVSAATSDPLATNNSAEATSSVLALADLRLEVGLASPGALVVGDRLALNLAVTNLGPSTASALRVNLLLPAGFTLVAGPIGCASTPSPGCDLGELVQGASVSRVLQLDTLGASAGAYDLGFAATSSALDPPPPATASLRVTLAPAATQPQPIPLAPALGLIVFTITLLVCATRPLASSRRR